MKILKLKDLLKSNYSKYFDESDFDVPNKRQEPITEGLIVTHPLNKSVDIIERQGYDVILIDSSKFKNRFFVEFDLRIHNIAELLKLTNNLGWYCGQIRKTDEPHNNGVKFTQSNLKSLAYNTGLCLLLFEPKYDIELNLSDYPYLYHYTPKTNIEKIRKFGLTPKTQNKVANHPDRIYLTFTLKSAERFGKNIINRFNPDKKLQSKSGCILAVNTDVLTSNTKIYQDPNFYEEGCFTLNSIPPYALTVVKEFDVE